MIFSDNRISKKRGYLRTISQVHCQPDCMLAEQKVSDMLVSDMLAKLQVSDMIVSDMPVSDMPVSDMMTELQASN